MNVYKQADMFSPVREIPAKYAVLDFETGGTDAQRNSLCSVGLVRLDENLNEVDRYYTLIVDTPDKITDDEALRVNGLTREQIAKEGKPWFEVYAELRARLDGCILVAHNAQFDFRFLKNRGYPVEEAVCTMELSWKIWPTQKAKLGIVYNRMYGHEFVGAHNSLFDVLATVELMKWFNQKDPELLKPVPINWNRFKR